MNVEIHFARFWKFSLRTFRVNSKRVTWREEEHLCQVEQQKSKDTKPEKSDDAGLKIKLVNSVRRRS